ncbi:hypothetical protein [Methanoculleus chikugoensis]|uniref:hypothetical protein n=1 Tax=Methanoculleus chikugoensis TaxID=118126 RepID=UPI000AC0B601|nr:hypothetical protein [Methanoculleus chikugoensis]
MKTQWDRVGYRFTDRCVVLRGHVVDAASSGTYWRRALFGRWLIMSSHQMTEETLPDYVDRIRRFMPPRFIHVYPSTAVILARYMREHGIEPIPTVKAVLCGSENLYPPWQRDLLTEVFGCRVFSWYGNSEQTVLAGECEESTRYHIFPPEYGIVELIGRDGRPVEGGRRHGRGGRDQPHQLRLPPHPLPHHGHRGRHGKAVLLRERVSPPAREGRGGEAPGVHRNPERAPDLRHPHQLRIRSVREYTAVPDVPGGGGGELIMKIVRKPAYTEKDTRQLTDELRCQLGDGGVNVHVRFVDEIPRTEGGKFRYLIQKLPISIGDL